MTQPQLYPTVSYGAPAGWGGGRGSLATSPDAVVAEVTKGIPPFEAFVVLRQALQNGSWAASTMSAIALVADAAAFYIDPLGNGAAWAVSLALEHVEPLTRVLNELGGDPDAIRAGAQRWRAIG